MKEVAWKRAVITGGSSGIGYELAKILILRGIDVLLLARGRERLEAAVEALSRENAHPASRRKGAFGISPAASSDGALRGRVEYLSLDVTKRDELEGQQARLIGDHGGPLLLVNSAGTAYPDYFERIPYEVYRKTVEVNLGGTWNITQLLVPHLEAGSHIVNVSSVAGFVGTFGYTAYSASKFAITGFSEALRNELASRGIGVSVLCPPDTRTPQLEEEEKTKPPETRAISGNAAVLEPAYVAECLLRGVKKRRFFIVPGIHAKLIYWVHSFLPKLLYHVLDREVEKVAKRKKLS